MRKYLALVVLMLATMAASAQYSTGTGTITDSASTNWGGATVTATFYPAPNFHGLYTWNGAQQSTFPSVTSTANSSGAFSIQVPDNSLITPAKTMWAFVICPLASKVCQTTVPVSMVGGSVSLTALIANTITPPAVNPTGIQYAYNDGEVLPMPGLGQVYYRTSDLTFRQWNGSAWVAVGGGGSNITLQTNGTNNASQSALNLKNGANVTITNTSGGDVTISASGGATVGPEGTVQVAGSTAGTHEASTPAYVATSLLSPALNNFRTALYSSSTGGTPATSTNVLVIGTSITCCIGPALAADSPMAQLKSTLKQFGSNGTGVVPVGANGSTFTRPEWALAGTWAVVPDLGPQQTNPGAGFASMFVASGNGVGNTLTMANQSGDTLLLYAETTTDSGGCAVSVDGGAPGIFANTTSGSPTMTLTTYNPGPGNHTIVVQPSGAGKCYFYAAQWENANTSGVILNNIAHGYATTNAYCLTPSAQMAVVPLISPAPSLAIIELGVNEIIEGTINQATYSSQMQACVTYLRGINPNMSILFLDDYNINPASIGTGITYAQVRTTEQSLATSNNAAYMSIGDSWGTYAQANALGLMNGDGLHPSNLGGINYGALVASYITMGINNLPLNTIKPFVVQQPYPADVSEYSLLNNNPQSPSTSKLSSGLNLFVNTTGRYATGFDLGINTVNGDYGPRLYNNDGNTSSSSDVIFQHYNHAAGIPKCQGAGCGWIQDGYVESNDSSLHIVGKLYGAGLSLPNCSSSASPAVCGANTSGSVVIATSATSVVVNTTAVTANSQILVVPDESLGTKLGVTCNTTATVALASYGVTARTSGTSFTISTTGTVATNPACYSFTIVN